MGEKDHRPRIHWRIHLLGNDADPQEEQYQDGFDEHEKTAEESTDNTSTFMPNAEKTSEQSVSLVVSKKVQRQTWKKKDLKAIKIHKKRLSCQVPNMGL